ncbi:MAG: hypothetical protein QNJ16_18525 [Rhodobacter sp.]|nr:hypothetical protein [Rhodobacter sp.]
MLTSYHESQIEAGFAEDLPSKKLPCPYGATQNSEDPAAVDAARKPITLKDVGLVAGSSRPKFLLAPKMAMGELASREMAHRKGERWKS